MMPSRLLLALIATLAPSLAVAAGARCPDESGLRSSKWAVPTSITFVNRMPIALRIYWINYDGVRQLYAVVAPHQRHRQQTYVTHPWVLTDEHENCIAVYLPTQEPRQVAVTGERAGARSAPQSKAGAVDAAQTSHKQPAADARLVGVWLGLRKGARFPFGCDSGEPVHYSSDGTYTGPGARGTWQLRDDQLTEIVKEVGAEIGDPASAKVGEPYTSKIVWKGSDAFVRTFRDGTRMTFRRCPVATTSTLAADDEAELQRCIWQCLAGSKGNNDPRYHACVEKTCVTEKPARASRVASSVARSKAADYLVREEIASACESDGAKGKIADTAVIERDLTGDGKADLIISHEGITCANGRRSNACGAQVCSVMIYVRRGALLKLERKMLGAGVEVDGGAIPIIRTHTHGGRRGAISWNGREFR